MSSNPGRVPVLLSLQLVQIVILQLFWSTILPSADGPGCLRRVDLMREDYPGATYQCKPRPDAPPELKVIWMAGLLTCGFSSCPFPACGEASGFDRTHIAYSCGGSRGLGISQYAAPRSLFIRVLPKAFSKPSWVEVPFQRAVCQA